MKFSRLWLSLALTGSLFSAALAQTAVQDPSGFRTVIPAGFTFKQDATGILAGNAAQTAAIVVKAHAYANFTAFAADANLARDGFTLVGEPRDLGNGGGYFRATRPNPQGGLVVADTFVTFSPSGGGAVVVALSDDKNADTAYYAAAEVVNQMTFVAPTASATSTGWDAALRGKRLVYLYTGNGYSERFDIFLGRDGTFAFRSNMSSSSMNGTGVAGGLSDGRWQITPAGQLLLSYYDGRSASYTLSPRQAGNEVGLNGKRYFVMSN